jgi:hypothetical protein
VCAQLNPPYATYVYDRTGTVVWSDTTAGNRSELLSLRSVSPRFIDTATSAPAAPVDVVSAWEEEPVPYGYATCVVNGFSSTDSGGGQTGPQWVYAVQQCYTDLIDNIDVLKQSDDGSTVAVYVITNSTLPVLSQEVDPLTGYRTVVSAPEPTATQTLQVHVLDAATGHFIAGFQVPNGELAPRGVDITADGTAAAEY